MNWNSLTTDPYPAYQVLVEVRRVWHQPESSLAKPWTCPLQREGREVNKTVSPVTEERYGQSIKTIKPQKLRSVEGLIWMREKKKHFCPNLGKKYISFKNSKIKDIFKNVVGQTKIYLGLALRERLSPINFSWCPAFLLRWATLLGKASSLNYVQNFIKLVTWLDPGEN